MQIHDIVWGKVNITDKDIAKIISHKSMQRIKHVWISTYGYLFELKRNATRYEHCVGSYLLLNHFKATKEAQIAALIHDVAVTAFSHVSTYAMQKKYTGAEYHDMHHHRLVEESGLGDLLRHLGYNPEELFHEGGHTLAENELPDICADRIDYALRDSLHLQVLSKQQVEQVIAGLKVHDGEFVFTNVDAAFTYSFAFYVLNLMFYGSPMEAHFNHHYGKIIKFAIDSNVLKESDWFTDDIKVLHKLNKSRNSKIKDMLSKFNNKIAVYEDRKNFDTIYSKKIRVVDPKVLVNGKLKRLTEVEPAYKKLVDEYKQTHQKHELPVKVQYKK